MENRKGLLKNIFLITLLVSLGGCSFYKEKLPRDSFFSSDPSGVSYKQVHVRILVPHCISCHGNSGGINLESYGEVKKHLSAIERSVIIYRTMPKGGYLPPEDLGFLAAWIKSGAAENPGNGPVEEPLKATFVSIKKKIFESRCISCHTQEGSASSVPLATLKDLLGSPRELVIPGNSEDSGLFLAITRTDDKRMPPPGSGSALSPKEISIIQKWIESGAPEGEVLPEQPLEPKFFSLKKKVFEPRCISCHSGVASKGDVSFESLKKLLSSPRQPLKMEDEGDPDSSGLLIALTHPSPFKRMPPPESGSVLTSEEIAVIREWVKVGAIE